MWGGLPLWLVSGLSHPATLPPDRAFAKEEGSPWTGLAVQAMARWAWVMEIEVLTEH